MGAAALSSTNEGMDDADDRLRDGSSAVAARPPGTRVARAASSLHVICMYIGVRPACIPPRSRSSCGSGARAGPSRPRSRNHLVLSQVGETIGGGRLATECWMCEPGRRCRGLGSRRTWTRSVDRGGVSRRFRRRDGSSPKAAGDVIHGSGLFRLESIRRPSAVA